MVVLRVLAPANAAKTRMVAPRKKPFETFADAQPHSDAEVAGCAIGGTQVVGYLREMLTCWFRTQCRSCRGNSEEGMAGVAQTVEELDRSRSDRDRIRKTAASADGCRGRALRMPPGVDVVPIDPY